MPEREKNKKNIKIRKGGIKGHDRRIVCYAPSDLGGNCSLSVYVFVIRTAQEKEQGTVCSAKIICCTGCRTQRGRSRRRADGELETA
ncbi:hypothetical protein D3C86_1984190 [compost metagenome]